MVSRLRRYVALPIIVALPGALVALWIAIAPKPPSEATARSAVYAWSVFGAAIWAVLGTGFKSWAEQASTQEISKLQEAKDEAWKLIALIRLVVGYKSRRFHEAVADLSVDSPPGEIFTRITQPDAQIKQIVEAIHQFFERTEAHEQITVTLMEWDEAKKHLVFCEHFPDADRPSAVESHFGDSHTVAGKAYFDNELAISDDVEADPLYRTIGKARSGSMFAFPVFDQFENRVIFVVNVFSTKVKRFLKDNAESIRVVMAVFEDRLILENQLLRLKTRRGVGG